MKVERYLDLKQKLLDDGWDAELDWAENQRRPPDDGVEFALETIYVICNSGMKQQIARGVYNRVRAHIMGGKSAIEVFGHKGKAAAIDLIWKERDRMCREYLEAEDKLGYLGNLPWIGSITKYHLAKNFGLDVCKPDRHLVRIAKEHGEADCMVMCARLARESGDCVALVDSVLWRAANLGWL